MLTQFFGNYLLEKQVINSDQLIEALRHKHAAQQKVETLALNSGYITEEEVEDVHNMQSYTDNEFIELALHMGYLTVKQASELEEAQHFGYLFLGRAIVDLGFCSREKMVKLITDYEFEYQLSFSNCLNFDKDKLDDLIHKYYGFPDSDELNPAEFYAVLLLKNLIRFVGNDFRLSGRLEILPSLPDMLEVTQEMAGSFLSKTGIIGYKNFMEEFAGRYACEDLNSDVEFIEASLQDFLNLHNGLFIGILSNQFNQELSLTPPKINPMDKKVPSYQYILPIEFTFGTIYFCFNFQLPENV